MSNILVGVLGAAVAMTASALVLMWGGYWVATGVQFAGGL